MVARKKIVEPTIDPELYKIMKGVYARWTGYELADVIKVIRAEIEAEQQLKQELAQLEQLKEKHEVSSDDIAGSGHI
jgi:hypothetical protein